MEQHPGEDIRDYLLRVEEGLSRAVNFEAGLAQRRNRKDFVCLSVNGLASKGLRDPCRSKDDLTWKYIILDMIGLIFLPG